jgi:hypothetical protein
MGVPRHILAAMGLSLLLQGLPAQAQDGPRVFTEKDEIYDLIENCTPSRSRESVLSDPDSPLTVSCRNTCFEARLNSWLAESPDNRQRYFATKDIYDIERSARLFTCREGSAMVEKSSCVGQFAPDILAKVGPIPCGESVNCEVRFDIDDAGRPTQLSATCQPGPAKAEYEREAMCLTQSMSFPSHRGRRNVVQPFEMKSDQSCPIS